MQSWTARAQKQIKTGADAPAYRVAVGNLTLAEPDIGTSLISATVTYDCQNGTSEAQLITTADLEDRVMEETSVKIGYGRDLAPYFDGELLSATNNQTTLQNEGRAYGPFKLMAGEVFGERADYRDEPIGDFSMDLHRRAGYRRESLEVRTGRVFTLQGDDVVFPEEAYLADAGRAVWDAAGFVYTDLPGRRRMVRQRPRFGSTGRRKAEYGPGSYPRIGGFTAVSETRLVFGSVMIFRRGEGGVLDFPLVKVRVHNEGKRRAGPNRAYVVPEFVGDQQDAEAEANRLARLLGKGLYKCTLAGIGGNPALLPYDTLGADAVEWRDEGGRQKEPYETEYEWMIDGKIVLSISREGMLHTLDGNGIRTSARKVRRNRYVRDYRRSPYVVRAA